jgi:hypothetical protein
MLVRISLVVVALFLLISVLLSEIYCAFPWSMTRKGAPTCITR